MKQIKYFEVVECSGSPYEIGQQIGAACRENIQKALDISLGGISFINNVSKASIVTNAMKYFP
ncbi:MAG: peptidase acyl-coenzyme A:6-aminopenicillanic acid acyl-transferase, partial [Firmicutes bacterium]|nr:peptidase acyl-coenzyme A:6-aminopenicillanic acid acyl-transferase [Bacillota bacterium]